MELQGIVTSGRQPNDIQSGMYQIHWSDGTMSDGCIGQYQNGDRWIVCSNWTGECVKLSEYWNEIKYLLKVVM